MGGINVTTTATNLGVKSCTDHEFSSDVGSSSVLGFWKGLKQHLDAGLGLHLNKYTSNILFFFFSQEFSELSVGLKASVRVPTRATGPLVQGRRCEAEAAVAPSGGGFVIAEPLSQGLRTASAQAPPAEWEVTSEGENPSLLGFQFSFASFQFSI